MEELTSTTRLFVKSLFLDTREGGRYGCENSQMGWEEEEEEREKIECHTAAPFAAAGFFFTGQLPHRLPLWSCGPSEFTVEQSTTGLSFLSRFYRSPGVKTVTALYCSLSFHLFAHFSFLGSH